MTLRAVLNDLIAAAVTVEAAEDGILRLSALFEDGPLTDGTRGPQWPGSAHGRAPKNRRRGRSATHGRQGPMKDSTHKMAAADWHVLKQGKPGSP
jgi:hypothetical protein